MVKTRNTKTKKNLKIVVPLKHVSNFWRVLDMPLINCEVSLTLTWYENCVSTDITTQTARAAQGDNPARPTIKSPTNVTYKMTNTKLYVPVVTLSTENDNLETFFREFVRLLEQLITGFKRNNKWNKYRSEFTNQTKNNNLNYLIDPIFTKVNRLFVLSFENDNNRTSFSKYYVPNVQIKELIVLTDGERLFDIPIKNCEQKYEQIIEMERNNDYTTDNSWDYEYFTNTKHYKLIAIDLSQQIELKIPYLNQQIKFIEKSETTTFEFLRNTTILV